jgi:hypothetical protein
MAVVRGGEGDLSSGGEGAESIGNWAHIIAQRYTNNSSSLKVCTSLREFTDEVNPESS